VVPGSRRRRSRRRWPRTPERSRSIPAWSCHRSVLSEPDAIDQTVNVYYIVLDRRSIAHGQVLLAQAIGHYPWQLGWRYRSPWRRVGRYESKREFSSSRPESAAATRTIRLYRLKGDSPTRVRANDWPDRRGKPPRNRKSASQRVRSFWSGSPREKATRSARQVAEVHLLAGSVGYRSAHSGLSCAWRTGVVMLT
jgi:hypothetical protein